jgi:transposase
LEVGIFIAKCSFELKKEIVDVYLSGEGSYSYLAEKYKIPQSAMIRRWVMHFNVAVKSV